MCDYSLMAVPNRLAQENEELVAHRFPTGSMGLASPAEVEQKAKPEAPKRTIWRVLDVVFNPGQSGPVTPVCIPPGSRLRLEGVPARAQRDYKVGPTEEVRFVQVGALENTYRDAIRFTNGLEMRLQELQDGQRVVVLDLGSAEDRQPVIEEVRRF